MDVAYKPNFLSCTITASFAQAHSCQQSNAYMYFKGTIDWEIFTLKIICVKNFCVVKFLRFCSIREFLLMVDDYNMDERLESSYHLVYYWVSGEPGITGCSRQLDIYPGECGLVRASLFIVIATA